MARPQLEGQLSETAWQERCLHVLLSADRAALHRLIAEAKNAGWPADRLLLDVISPALNMVGELWSQQKAALTQIYMAARLVEEVLPSLLDEGLSRSHPAGCQAPTANRVVLLGNAPGDYHGLGRYIVATYLRTAGLEVVDLGLSVPPRTFVEHALSHQARLIAISALMLHTAQNVADVRRLLDEAGATDVKILVGGAPFHIDPELYRQVGAQAMGRDAGEAVRQALVLLQQDETEEHQARHRREAE